VDKYRAQRLAKCQAGRYLPAFFLVFGVLPFRAGSGRRRRFTSFSAASARLFFRFRATIFLDAPPRAG
jgi:hypothetical protein